MNYNLVIHPLIRQPSILFIVILLFSASIVIVSNTYQEYAYDGREAAKRDMRSWKNKIDIAKESENIIDQYEERYLALLSNNIVGEENRLNWLETIQATANVRNMPSVKYNVSSQKLVEDKTGQHQAKGLKVYRSEMALNMKMAHEGDLFAMLNALTEKAQGLYVVEDCQIESSVKSLSKNSENMSADCTLGWYTFKQSDKKESKKRSKKGNRK